MVSCEPEAVEASEHREGEIHGLSVCAAGVGDVLHQCVVGGVCVRAWACASAWLHIRVGGGSAGVAINQLTFTAHCTY